MSNKPASFKRLEVRYGIRTKKSLNERTDKQAMAIKARQSTYTKRVSRAIQAAKKFVVKSVSMFNNKHNRNVKVDM